MACCSHTITHKKGKYRNALWAVLWLNLIMFIVEVFNGVEAESVSLLADSVDFFSDAANYLISIVVLNKALQYRAKASLLKGYSMILLGVVTCVVTLYQFWQGELPNYMQMSVIGLLALLANVLSAVILYRFREGDSNMRSVWLCSRNDALGNIAVVIAAIAVYFSQNHYPDLFVASIMAYLAIQAGRQINRQAKAELKGENNANIQQKCTL
ncbi:cation transporter [Ursidibacter sp. B-7004-1]